MTVREVRREDARSIAIILRTLGWFGHINEQTPEQTESNISERLTEYRPDSCNMSLVAEDAQGVVVGYIAVHWFTNLMLGNEGYVSELFLIPDETGKGVGGRLLEAVKQQALKRGCERLVLMNRRVRESYQRAFYPKHGWEERIDAAFFTLTLSEKS